MQSGTTRAYCRLRFADVYKSGLNRTVNVRKLRNQWPLSGRAWGRSRAAVEHGQLSMSKAVSHESFQAPVGLAPCAGKQRAATL